MSSMVNFSHTICMEIVYQIVSYLVLKVLGNEKSKFFLHLHDFVNIGFKSLL